MISRKFAYADDLALLHSSGNYKDLEGTLSQDMSTLLAYLQTWRLKLSHTKTVTAGFHLNNREAKRELKVYNNGRLLPLCPISTYLGIKLHRSLTFRHHLVALRTVRYEQTADHVLTACSIHRAPHGARGLTVLDDETRCWLNDITASI